jgi:hypothetical protein
MVGIIEWIILIAVLAAALAINHNMDRIVARIRGKRYKEWFMNQDAKQRTEQRWKEHAAKEHQQRQQKVQKKKR